MSRLQRVYSSSGFTALHKACIFGRVSVVPLLLPLSSADDDVCVSRDGMILALFSVRFTFLFSWVLILSVFNYFVELC